MKKLFFIFLLLCAAPALAQTTPDHKAVVQALFATGNYDLKTHDGQAIFVDDAVALLHMTDPKWGHLRKRMGQTQIHLHAEDAALYLQDNGLSSAVDFIGGAGGPNPSISWSVDAPRYSSSDWWNPATHSAAPPAPKPPVVVCPVCPPPPAKPAYPGDEVFDAIGRTLFADYAEAGQAPNEGMSRWFGRVTFDWLAGNVPTLDASIEKHRRSWRAALGLP